jgi:hypothetical protein
VLGAEMKTLLTLLIPIVILGCSKPFPIDDAIYAEYKAIACKIPTGQVTPEILARQLELNKIFEERLKSDGSPNSSWVAIHATKFAAALDMKTCDASSVEIKAPTSNSSVPQQISGQNNFDGVWHFNLTKSKAANQVADDEITKTVVETTLSVFDIEASNSAGIKIQNGFVQDGATRCNLEDSHKKVELNVSVNCVDQSDRSISAKYTLVKSNELMISTANSGAKVNFIFEKK